MRIWIEANHTFNLPFNLASTSPALPPVCATPCLSPAIYAQPLCVVPVANLQGIDRLRLCAGS